MTRSEYFENAQRLFSEDKISEDAFWAMLDNADAFVDEDEYGYQIPSTYAEIEYDDFDDPEAIAMWSAYINDKKIPVRKWKDVTLSSYDKVIKKKQERGSKWNTR